MKPIFEVIESDFCAHSLKANRLVGLENQNFVILYKIEFCFDFTNQINFEIDINLLYLCTNLKSSMFYKYFVTLFTTIWD